MRMKYRLICSDVDGTLIDGNEQITEENLQAIRQLKEKGIYFAISFDKKIDVENTAFYTHHGQRLDAVKEAFADNIFADIALCGAPNDFEMRIATYFIST